MAITAKFTADFDSFYAALLKADVSLKTFEDGAADVERQLAKMGNSFSGVRIIQDAHVMSAAMIELGGTSKLTDREMRVLAATVGEATEKMERMGQVVPPGFRRILDEAKRAEPPVRGLGDSLKGFDSALAAAGIHIGPEIRALGEMGEAAGQTATQFGLLATAGLALATGIGAWKLGRMIAEFTGSDKIIGDFVAKLSGVTAGAAEAGVVTDALALASSRAKRQITDISEAIQINIKWAQDWTLVHGRTKDAVRDTELAVLGWRTEIDNVASSGNLTQMTKDLESQNFSLEALSKKYGIHVEALQFFNRENKAAAETAKKAAEDHAAALTKAEAAARAYSAALQAMNGSINDINKVLGYAVAATESLGRVQADEAALNKYNSDVYRKSLEDIALQAQKTYEAAQASSSGFSEAAKSHFAAVAAAARLAADTWESSFIDAGASASAAVEKSATAAKASLASVSASSGQISGASVAAGDTTNEERIGRPAWMGPTRAMGGPVSAGKTYMVGERGPELFTPSSGGSISPNGGGASVIISPGAIVLNYPIMSDPRAQSELAAIVGAAIYKELTAKGMRVPSGA